MTQSQYTVRVLEPAPGCFLTQADDTISVADRIVSDRVFLAQSDSPECWKEISAIEANAITARKELLAESSDSAAG